MMRELLAAVVFMRHYHYYLYGREFDLQTDQASLTWPTNLQESSGMLARWLTTLGMYKYKTTHRKKYLHINSEALSRISLNKLCKCKREDCEQCALQLAECVCVFQTQNEPRAATSLIQVTPSTVGVLSTGDQALCLLVGCDEMLNFDYSGEYQSILADNILQTDNETTSLIRVDKEPLPETHKGSQNSVSRIILR